MAGFEGAKQWVQLAFLFIVLANIVDFGLWNASKMGWGIGDGGVDHQDEMEATQAMHFIGFLCLLASLALSIMMIFASKEEKPVKIALIVVLFVAAFFILVGTIMWGANRRDFGINTVYGDITVTCGVLVFALSACAGVFVLLDLLGK